MINNGMFIAKKIGKVKLCKIASAKNSIVGFGVNRT